MQALRKVGALVMHLNEFDLLVYRRGLLFMMDAKTGTAGTTLAQERLIADGWPLELVRSELDALAVVGATSYCGSCGVLSPCEVHR